MNGHKDETMGGNTVTVRRLCIGAGRPKICVPIVGKTEEEIYAQAENLNSYPADLVEWRADWFEDVKEPAAVLKVLGELRSLLRDLPLLFTIRTSAEGGELDIVFSEYKALNLAAACSGLVDLVDTEVFEKPVSRWQGRVLVKSGVHDLIRELQKTGVKVIASSHDFEKTPSKEGLLTALRAMQDMEPDICKIAVMPEEPEDVISLLNATWEMKDRYANRPLITMSMGQTGLVSRLCGELFGSAVTFGAAGKVSAPGQIGADKLAECLELLRCRKDSEASPVPSEEKDKEGHIFLIGFMGAGKSTVAAALKKRLCRQCMEMDERIEQLEGQSISSMFEQYGETYFRNKETNLLLSTEKEEPMIVSCGGGVVVRPENCSFMKQHGRIVLLTASPETVLERVKDSKDRPMLNGNMNVEYIRALQEKRRALYESVADVTVATDGKSVDAVCDEILAAIGLEDGKI